MMDEMWQWYLMRARVFVAQEELCYEGRLQEPEIRIEWRGHRAWAVVQGNTVMTRGGKWEYEPTPSRGQSKTK